VIEKANARLVVIDAGAIEIQRDLDLRFGGISGDRRFARAL
jgi:hypothetical protein